MNRYLIEEELPALLLPQIHLLHSHQLAGGFHCGDAHDPGRPLPYLDVVVQVGAWVSGVHHHLQRCSELLVGNSLRLPLWGAGL